MHIELKDLKTGKIHRIEEKGATFGRDKSRASILVDDAGVSGAHARIFLRDGQWYLEDLKSSNGSWVDDHRATAATALSDGSRIKLFNYKLEVVALESSSTDGATAVFSAETSIAEVKKPPAEEVEDDIAPDDPAKPKTGSIFVGNVGTTKKPAPTAHSSEPASTGVHELAAAEAIVSKDDNAAFAAHVKEALAYYVGAIPRLLLNVKGSVQKSIDDQHFPAMKPPQLVAWALPPLLFGMIVTQIVVLLLMIVSGHLAVGGFITGLAIGTVVSIVAAIIAGFIFHPVLAWLVKVLKGTSTDVSRSNYFVMVMTASGLTTIISGIGGLFGLIPLPFIGVVPLLLALAATLITIYLAYRWFQFFAVVKWFPIVILVLGGLACFGTLRGLYGTVDSGIAQLKAGHNTVVTVPVEGAHDAATDTAVKDAQEQGAKAVAAAAAAGVAVPVPAAMQMPPQAAQPQQAPPPTKADPRPSKTETPPATAIADNGARDAREPLRDDYQTYLKKREAVEQAIEKNPALLARAEGVVALYKQLHFEMKKVNERYAHQKGPKDVVTERLRDADMYDKTVDQVDALYRKVVPAN